MNIDYKWVNQKIIDKESLSKFCDSQRAVELCWWFATEVVHQGAITEEIDSLIQESAVKRVLRTDVMRVHIHNMTQIVLENPFTGSEFEYEITEFKEVYFKWLEELN